MATGGTQTSVLVKRAGFQVPSGKVAAANVAATEALLQEKAPLLDEVGWATTPVGFTG